MQLPAIGEKIQFELHPDEGIDIDATVVCYDGDGFVFRSGKKNYYHSDDHKWERVVDRHFADQVAKLDKIFNQAAPVGYDSAILYKNGVRVIEDGQHIFTDIAYKDIIKAATARYPAESQYILKMAFIEGAEWLRNEVVWK